MSLTNLLFYVQKAIDICIPFGYLLAQLNFVFRLVDFPPSFVAILHDPNITYMWVVGSFVSYLFVIIGVVIKPPPISDQKQLNNRKLGGAYLWFEFPGLISSAVFTAIYPIALWINFGFLGPSFAVICFILTISIYFFFRFLRQIVILMLAKSNIQSSGV